MSKKKSSSTILWQVPEIGNIIINRNQRAKRLTISVRPSSVVRVTVPGFLSVSTAKEFVEQKKNWIKDKLTDISTYNKSNSISSGFKTRTSELLLIPDDVSSIRVVNSNDLYTLYYPREYNGDDKIVQEAALIAVDRIYRKEAQKMLPVRVNELAIKHSFSYNNLRIKRTTSRWGSCSSKNNINLSIYLMKLPDDLIDYIILHELTHTVHKNHGPNFWNHLQKVTGNAKNLAVRVKKYRTGV